MLPRWVVVPGDKHGKGQKHDKNLDACLARLYENGIRLRREKCKLGKQSVMWFGHIYSKQGMSPDPAKVDHIKAWPAPKTKEEVKSFLQTVQFVAQYRKRDGGAPHSSVTAPLRYLTRQHVPFVWTRDCHRAFNELKARISHKTVLVPYQPNLDTRLYVDHGPAGIASTLAQDHGEEGKKVWKTVHHMSRSLVKLELNYPKIDGESLAIYSGAMMNRKYLLGAPFTVMTDHSALPAMYNNPTRSAPDRVDRHRGRLGAFDMKVEFVPGDKHPCDYGSRHPQPLPNNMTKQEREDMGIETEEEDMEIWMGRIKMEVMPAITLEQLRDDTENDPELRTIVREKRTAQMSKETSKGPYGKMWQDIRERDGILLKEGKIIVPKRLQPQAIDLAHEGHMLADRTLRPLRENLWFRNMRNEVQAYVSSCKCATANPKNPKPPLKL